MKNAPPAIVPTHPSVASLDRLGDGAAREKVRVARALGTLPRLAGALALGELSYSKVRALTQPGQSVLEDGVHVPAGTSRHLACDASRVVMRQDAAGRLVEIGARTRTIPPALRRTLLHRDRGCRFPGCGVRVGQGHHLRHWAQGGPTTLSNLALLCRRHHRAVHEEGYQVERGPRCRPTRCRRCGPSTTRGGSASTPGRHARAGRGSALISAGRSTSCIPWPEVRSCASHPA